MSERDDDVPFDVPVASEHGEIGQVGDTVNDSRARPTLTQRDVPGVGEGHSIRFVDGGVVQPPGEHAGEVNWPTSGWPASQYPAQYPGGSLPPQYALVPPSEVQTPRVLGFVPPGSVSRPVATVNNPLFGINVSSPPISIPHSQFAWDLTQSSGAPGGPPGWMPSGPPGGGGWPPPGGGWSAGGPFSGPPGPSYFSGVPHNVSGVGGHPAFPPTFPTYSQPSAKLTPKLDPIKLNDNNWVHWSRYIHAIIIEIGVEHCIRRDMTNTFEDYKAQALILQSCTDEYLVQISDLTSAFAMWNHLISLFTGRTNGKLMSLNEEIRLFKMKHGEKPSAYVLRARRITNTIRSLGRQYDDLSVCMMILNGLTPEYEQTKQIQQNLCYHDPDVSRLQHTLELVYMSLDFSKQNDKHNREDKSRGKLPYTFHNAGKSNQHSSHHVQTPGGTNVNTGTQGPKTAFQQVGRPTIICHHCGEPGHIKPNCPQLKGNTGPSSTNCVELLSVSCAPSSPGWLVDSGSTDHISFDNSNMLDYIKYDKPEYLIVANGQREEIVGEGTCQILLETGCTFMLYNVKHVPSSKKRLMSVGKAYHDGINVNIMGIDCFVTDSNSNMLGRAEHIYPYQWIIDMSIKLKKVSFASDTNFNESCLTQVESDKVNLWHQRLGHLSPTNMEKMKKENMVTGMTLPHADLSKHVGDNGKCSACLTGKQTSGPFKQTGHMGGSVLEIVHVDLMGPIQPETPDGESYALCVLDEFSEFSAVILLKTKNDAAKELIALLKQWETQSGNKVQFLRSDNGTEFNGVLKFCRDNGIVHQRTAPYAHQQNGKIERLNRTLQERARAMLAGSSLPPEYWGDALLTSNYVRNLSAVSNLTCTPYQKFHGKVPDVSHLRVFGSKCFVLTPKLKRGGKFFPVSAEGVFLGYDNNGPNYRVLIYSKVEIVCKEHVKFSEVFENSCEDLNDLHGDVPDLSISPDDDADSDLDYVTHEGVQATMSPRDVHDVFPGINPADVLSGLERGGELASAGDAGMGGLSQQEQTFIGARSGILEGADSMDHDDQEPRYTSPFSPRPASSGVPQVGARKQSEVNAPSSQVDPVEFDFQDSGVPVNPAGMFGGRYPVRNRRTVVSNTDQTPSSPSPQSFSADTDNSLPFLGYVQVQKDTLILEPSTYFEAVNSPEAEKWVDAMKEEMHSLSALGTWSYVEVSDHVKKKALPVKWVYKVKLNEIGEVNKFKARLVAKGFKQIYGIDYKEVYAPVSKHSTLRYLLSVAVHRNLEIHQMDVSTAFLHGNLEEQIFIQQPQGFHVGGPNVVCELHKALYGLKQAPRAWYNTFCDVVKSAGFVVSEADPSLFILNRGGGDITYVLLYVDDILIFSKKIVHINAVKSLLKSHFAIKDLGEAKHFLGMKITFERDESGNLLAIKLSNEKLISDMLESFNMSNCKPKSTPLDPGMKLKRDDGEPLPLENRYRELVGGLLYLSTTIRPDISYVSGLLGRFSSQPTSQHMAAGMHVLRYLSGTKTLGLKWTKGNAGLEGFVDSDFAGDQDSFKSTSGFVFLSGGTAVSWASKLQPISALSTVEAEFISLCSGVQEALWLSKLSIDVGDPPSATVIYTDNTGALVNVKGIPISPRTKHIGVRYHRVRGEVERGAIDARYVSSQDNPADTFTKNLPKSSFVKFREMIGLM